MGGYLQKFDFFRRKKSNSPRYPRSNPNYFFKVVHPDAELVSSAGLRYSEQPFASVVEECLHTDRFATLELQRAKKCIPKNSTITKRTRFKVEKTRLCVVQKCRKCYSHYYEGHDPVRYLKK